MSALELAKYIVTKCINDDKPITNLYLQDILYKIQKEWLRNKSRAFYDDFEAWRFGPVIPNVHYYFVGCFGVMPITTKYPNITIDNPKAKAVIDAIIEKECIKPIWAISEENTKYSGAWKKVMHESTERPNCTTPIGYNRIIPIEYIAE